MPKRIDPVSRSIRQLNDKVRISYLSARERPKDYSDEWEETVKEIQRMWDAPSDMGEILRDKMEESLLFSEQTNDPKGAKAKRIYETIKGMKDDSDITKDLEAILMMEQ